MTPKVKKQMQEILDGKAWEVRPRMMKLMSEVEDVKEEKLRTDSQHRALFLWFTMIEKEAENQGITWDMVIKHTHQLRITKEQLHGMCKTLQKALWKTTSTKELKKTGNIDIIIDHFTDLLGKAGMETPAFPNDQYKLRPLIESQKIAGNIDYPEHEEQVTF